MLFCSKYTNVYIILLECVIYYCKNIRLVERRLGPNSYTMVWWGRIWGVPYALSHSPHQPFYGLRKRKLSMKDGICLMILC